MKAVFILGLLLILGNAVAEEVRLGPYRISYDMGSFDYISDSFGPLEEESYSGTEYERYVHAVTSGSSTIIIILNEFPESMVITFGDFYKNSNADKAYLREIDGHNSTLLVDERVGKSPSYSIAYTLESRDWFDQDGQFYGDRWDDQDAILYGNNTIEIDAEGDWDTVRQLLNTIHIEKAM